MNTGRHEGREEDSTTAAKPRSGRGPRERRALPGGSRLAVRMRSFGFEVPIQVRRGFGFTRTEILVMAVMIGLLAGMLLPALYPRRGGGKRFECVNHLKQLGLAYRIFATDNEDRFPMQLMTNAAGGMAHVRVSEVFRYYIGMSNELSTPKVLVCPNDTRAPASTFASLSDSNISYFVGLRASEQYPQSLLGGDRNLEIGGHPVPPGLVVLRSNSLAGWTRALHVYGGNVVLGDGSVQQMSNPRLRQFLSGSDPLPLLVP